METQKLINLLNSSENEYSNFATKNGILLMLKQRWAIRKKTQLSF